MTGPRIDGVLSRDAILDGAAAMVDCVGAEMRGGSDGSASAGAAVLPFLGLLPPAGARVLIAGPPDAALITRLTAAGHRIDVQLRGSDDAAAAAAALAPGIRVRGGSLARVDDRYDLVLALGGLHRLASADAPLDGWAAALDALHSLVADGGLLACAVANGFGIDRMTSADLAPARRTDPYAGNYPALADHLDSLGLTVEAEAGLYPGAIAPTVLIHRAILDGATGVDRPDDVPATLVATAYRSAVSGPDAVADPRRVARDSIAHGLGFVLAPGWLIVARRITGRPGAPIDPAVVVTGVVTQLITPVPGSGWLRTRIALDGQATAQRPGLRRHAELLDGKMPAGRLLEERFLAATGAHDMIGLREELGRYARWYGVRTAWLAGPDATEPPEPDPCAPDRVFGAADNVVVDGDGFRLIDPGWRTDTPVRADIAFVAALHRFATRLLSSALPHPWAAAQTPGRLATRLASMAGLVVRDADLAAAQSLSGTLAVALDGPPEPPEPVANPADPADAGEPDLVRDNATAGTGTTSGEIGLTRPAGYAAAVRTAAAVNDELAAARAQLRWLAEIIEDRDARLIKTMRELSKIKKSATYRLARVLNRPVKSFRKVLRSRRRTKE